MKIHRKRDIISDIRKMKDEEIISIMGGEVENIVPNTSLFVTRGGDVIDVSMSDCIGRTHEDYIWGLIKRMADIDTKNISSEGTFKSALKSLNMKGWIRMGTGSSATNKIYYTILPDYLEQTPTNIQYSYVEDFIDLAYDQGKEFVIIYFSPYDIGISRTYYFDEHTPADILRIIKRYYSSGRIYEGLRKRLKEDIEEDGVDCTEELLQAMVNLTEAELNEAVQMVVDDPFINEMAISTSAPEGPCFILRDGRYLYSPSKEVIHFDILDELLRAIYYVKIQGDDCASYEYWLEENGFNYEDVPYESHMMDYATDILGLVRANSGTLEETETKLYFVIPTSTNTKQVYALWDFLDKFVDDSEQYQAFFMNGANLRWHIACDPIETSSDEFIEIVRRYLATGKKPLGEKLNKLNEVYPNRGESKKDFIKRFMSVTKDEYPDVKQRYAIAINTYSKYKK